MCPARFEVRSAGDVRALIADAVLGARGADASLGTITLESHQLSAIARLQRAIDEFGGALLADDVGMGKTFVAAAISRRYERRLVVAPAVLSPMWMQALGVAGVTADFLSFERLSRLPRAEPGFDLVIVDECHHARTVSTRRFANLASISRGSHILLLSATPIHNSRDDLVALLSLFLGSRAASLTESEMSRCVVRRERQLLWHALFPEVRPVVCLDVPDDPGLTAELMALPAPLPPRDGGAAGTLIARGLIHQWASSEAALGEAVNRRLAKGIALSASLAAGRYPTARELATWEYGDGAVQLGFPELLAPPVAGASELLVTLEAHVKALRAFRDGHRGRGNIDAHRVSLLSEVRTRHPRAKIVAFAQYAETASMLYSRLAGESRIALLTAGGARVAGGPLTREDALDRFSPRSRSRSRPARGEEIDLLLTTDLLSEGVNLQDAEVVVHLDVPWTAARLEQRVGRAARMGSAHPAVSVYLFRPPASAADLLHNELLVQHKWSVAKDAIGSSSAKPFSGGVESSNGASPAAINEKLRRHHERWRSAEVVSGSTTREVHSVVAVATVAAPCTGFLAVVAAEHEPVVVAGELVNDCWNIRSTLAAQLDAVERCDGEIIPTDPLQADAALDAIDAWVARFSAATSAGLMGSASTKRKSLLQRIDAIVEQALPHRRASLSARATRARRVAAMQHGPAIERELAQLSGAMLAPEVWLDRVGSLAPRESESDRAEPQSRRIRAVLFFRPPV